MKVLSRFSPEFGAAVLVAFAAFLAIGFDSWRLSKPGRDLSFIARQVPITAEIELLQEYVRFDTSNPPGRELEAATWLAAKLRHAGVEAEIIESLPGRANVYARLEGRTKGEGLLLTHHIDVVPADPEGWTFPPFDAEIAVGLLYGRGVLDMKSIGICHLVAFTEVAQSGVPLERDLVFLAVADEETGGDLGMGWLVKNRPDIFEGVRYAVNEGGVTETRRSDVTFFGVEVATKQIVTLELHASDRRSLERARTALLPLQNPIDPTRVLPQVRDALAATAGYREVGREQLADVERTIERGDFWKLHPAYRSVMQNVVTLGGIQEVEGRLGISVVLRNLPDRDSRQEIERVRDIVEPYGVELEVVREGSLSGISSWDTPFVRHLASAVRQTYGDVGFGPQIPPFGTNDSKYLRPLGIDTYGFWPFPVQLFQTSGIHGIDENLRLDWFLQGVQMTHTLVHGYVFPGQGMSQSSAN
jgi:acetylornithine deacetylase/succinyl-diaminopimelate desuccinylase-like protein